MRGDVLEHFNPVVDVDTNGVVIGHCAPMGHRAFPLDASFLVLHRNDEF